MDSKEILEGYGNGWEMKYIRIYRFPLGFLICTYDSVNPYILNKEKLSKPVEKSNLHG